MTSTTPEWVTEHGDTSAPATEILRTVVGSEVHGIGIAGTDDHDEMGVYVEPAHRVIGLERVSHHYVARTQPEGHRSHHGDTDLVLYSLRKYLGMVTAGNPTALLPLFAPREHVLVCTELGEQMRAFGPRLLSQHAGYRFLGYLRQQRDRVTGQDTRHTPNRPELVERYGFDTKYASHAVRLGTQGVEVVQHGRLTLPLPERDREMVVAVKTGEVPLAATLDLIDARAEQIETILLSGRSPLPQAPDLDEVNRWLTQAHLNYWAEVIR